MSKTEHTPTPWKAVETNDDYGTWEIIADDTGQCLIATVENDNADMDAQLADAEFIVRACNSHDALAEALQAVMETFEREYQKLTDGRDGTTQNFTSMWMARSALRAAGIE